jgi:hypothetical protein
VPAGSAPPPSEAETIDPRSPAGVARRATRRRPDFEPSPRARTARLAAVLLAIAPLAAAAQVDLSASPESSSDGVIQVRWSGADGVVLEESRRPDFADAREVYRGTDRSTVLTGRIDGAYHYRLLALDGSDPIAPDVNVEVAHHPLPRAFAFFGVGLFVFVCTTALVLSDPDPSGPSGDDAHG